MLSVNRPQSLSVVNNDAAAIARGSMVEKLSTDHPLQGPLVDDICAILRELYPLASAKLGFRLNDEREENHQTNS